MSPLSGIKPVPAYSPQAQTALLKAANSLFDLDYAAESLDELANGALLAQILHELDPEFDPSQLDHRMDMSNMTNKHNIQTVYKGLFRFTRRQVPELNSQAKKFDHRSVTDNSELQRIIQLLAVMVSAAAMGPDNSKYVPRIQHGLDRDNQAEIMQIIRAMQQDVANSKDSEDTDGAVDTVLEARDIDLLVEEKNAALRHQLDSTKKNLSDCITRLEHLQQSHEELKSEKEKNDRELEVLRKATQDGTNTADAIKLREAQIHEQMEIIARNEEIIRNHDRVTAQLESEVQRLTLKSAQADELQDQVAEWKHRTAELEKKANTAERYKQKLESQQHLAREVQNLQYEKAELQEQLRSLVDDRDQSDGIRRAEDELTKMITQSEQHLWDERNQKNQLIKDLTALEEELMRLKAQKTHDERFIQDLQEQMQHGASFAAEAESFGAALSSSNLKDELLDASNQDKQSNLPLDLSRLKAENELLRRTLGSTGDGSLLRRDLDEQRRQNARLQQNFNDLFEKHTLAREQFTALMNDSASQGSRAFINLQNRATHLQGELDRVKRQADDLRSKISDAERELTSARAKLSVAEKDGVAAIDELRSTDKLISESLKAELDRLREDYHFVVSERDAQKTQLIEALLAKDRFRKEVEDAKDLQETASTYPAETDMSEAMKKSGEKIEKLRARLKERKQQLEQSEQEKQDLQNQLKSAKFAEASAGQGAAADHLTKDLQRENALISTAWYDLTSRLQSNVVVLQRRHDAPRSWLGKQRQMVNAASRRRDLTS